MRTTTIKDLDFITVKMAADNLHVAESTIRREIKDGKLIALKVGTVYRIDTKDFKEYTERSKKSWKQQM